MTQEPPKTPSKTPRIHVPRAEFLRAWETSETAAEVSDILGIKHSSVLARASQLRKLLKDSGITLKKLGRTRGEGGGRRISVDETVAMIRQIRGEQKGQGMVEGDMVGSASIDNADTDADTDVDTFTPVD